VRVSPFPIKLFLHPSGLLVGSLRILFNLFLSITVFYLACLNQISSVIPMYKKLLCKSSTTVFVVPCRGYGILDEEVLHPCNFNDFIAYWEQQSCWGKCTSQNACSEWRGASLKDVGVCSNQQRHHGAFETAIC
jgi:hypothetical protein